MLVDPVAVEAGVGAVVAQPLGGVHDRALAADPGGVAGQVVVSMTRWQPASWASLRPVQLLVGVLGEHLGEGDQPGPGAQRVAVEGAELGHAVLGDLGHQLAGPPNPPRGAAADRLGEALEVEATP